MAKTANNSKGKVGKARAAGKQAPAGKPVAKRTDSRLARGKAAQKSRLQARAARPREKRGFGKFLRDVRIEMGKVTWPTRKDLMQSTLVVLVAVAIATAYTGVLDFAFSKLVDVVLNVLT
ncbi:MAG: preprotein translocase subunit SecE [Thermoleophilia bacterium]